MPDDWEGRGRITIRGLERRVESRGENHAFFSKMLVLELCAGEEK